MFGQIQTPIDSLVTIDIATIRKANEKLIELNHLRKIAVTQDSIILDYKILSVRQDSLIYNYQINNITLSNELSQIKEVNENLNKTINKNNKFITLLSGITITSLITTILCLVIKK